MRSTRKGDTEFAQFKRFMAKQDAKMKKEEANAKQYRRAKSALTEQVNEYETMQDNLKEKNQ